MASLNYFDKDKQEWVAIPLGGSGGDSAVTEHDEPLPQPAVPTPQGIEDTYAAYPDGLHYFKQAGAVVSIVRDAIQISIVITGQVRSVVRIVKSDAGLPTPQNPSTFLNSTPDGKWTLLSSDQLDASFDNPLTVDLFDIPKALFDRDIRLGNVILKSVTFQDAYTFGVDNVGIGVRPYIEYSNQGQVTRIIIPSQDDVYTKTEVDTSLSGAGLAITQIQDNVSNANGKIAALEAGKADKADTYTKKQVDDAREADKDFSITNDNVLLASLTSLQEVVSNLGELGTAQIDVLDAIRDVEIQPSVIRLTGDAASPIAWKGGLSLAPVKDGADWRLGWNDGKNAHSLFTFSDFTAENIQLVVASEPFAFGGIVDFANAISFQGDFAVARDANRLVTQSVSGPLETLAYLSDIVAAPSVDLTAYAKVTDANQVLTTKSVLAQDFAFSTTEVLRVLDTGEGYGPRLSYITVESGQPKIDMVVLKDDLEHLAGLLPRVKAVEAAQGLAAGKLNINDPALNDFRKSMLDAVALMLAGGTKQPPPDIGWTKNGTHVSEVRLVAGVLEFRGVCSMSTGSNNGNLFSFPANFPLPENACSFPVAARLVGSNVVAAYVNFSTTSRVVSITAAGNINEYTLTGLRVRAAY